MIDRELAESFIQHVTQYTDYNVNIMDENGVIIASRDSGRVGMYHEIAAQVVHSESDLVEVHSDSAFRGVRRGINMVIKQDGRRIGCVGVSGDPDVIRPVALMTKMAMETMMRYESEKEKLRRRANSKEQFMYLLLQAETPDADEIQQLARELRYTESRTRIAILVNPGKAEGTEPLQELKSGPIHTHEDISWQMRNGEIILFKVLPESWDRQLTDYRYIVEEYLEPFLSQLRAQDPNVHYMVSTLQDRFEQYRAAYRQCRWMEEHFVFEKDETGKKQEGIYFYDHIGEYLGSILPKREMDDAFAVYVKRMGDKNTASFREIAGALIGSNYNFAKAAQKLYIHKNTLFYRYNAIKNCLNIDPVTDAEDRIFMESLYTYLNKECADSTK